MLLFVGGNQCLGPGGVEGWIASIAVVLGPLGEEPIGRLGEPAAEELYDLGLVGRLGQCLANPEIVGRRAGTVQKNEGHVGFAGDVGQTVDHLVGGLPGEVIHGDRVGRQDQIHASGLEGRLPLGGVGDGPVGNRIEVGIPASPVVRIPGRGEVVVGLPGVVDERAGTDRVGRRRRRFGYGVEHGLAHHIANLGGEGCGKRHEGIGKVVHHRQRIGDGDRSDLF